MDFASLLHLFLNRLNRTPMRIWYTILLIVLSVLALHAQDRVVEGWLNASDGSPLPGINVVIKGTTTGTTTDANGHYSIAAPIGSTLVFSFIGMRTREMLVTTDDFTPESGSALFRANLAPVPRELLLNSAMGRGIAVLTDSTAVHDKLYGTSPSAIRSIRRAGSRRFHIRTDANMPRLPFELQFTTAFALEYVTQLPALQDTYAQGRPMNGQLSWRGSDQLELFSWGPRVDVLEYDGSTYAYGRQGKLVARGTGNGQAAASYGMQPFFKTAVTSANEVIVQFGRGRGRTIVDIEQRDRKGIIPGTHYDKLNAMIRMNDYAPFTTSDHRVFNTIDADMSMSYNRAMADLPIHGGNLAAVMGGLLTTPATFSNQEGYRMADGTVRSYAPGVSDNPWGIVREFPDRDVLDRATGAIAITSYPSERFNVMVGGNAELQRSKNRFGTPPGYSGFTPGRLTERQEDQRDLHAILSSQFKSYLNYPNSFTVNGSYQLQLAERELQRTDASRFDAESHYDIDNGRATTFNSRRFHRTTHEVVLSATYERDSWLRLRVGDQVYFSNTLIPGSYTNFFPSAAMKIDLAGVLALYPVHLLEFYGVVSRLPREAPLVYGNWSYTTLNTQAEHYSSAYEGSELYMWRGLRPEIVGKMEGGVRVNANNVLVDIYFYKNKTDDFVAPVDDNGIYRLINAASVVNRGVTITTSYDRWSGDYNWGIRLGWSKYINETDRIYVEKDFIPLAGFSDIQTVLAPGKPLGAIYGSAYLRNAAGEKIIGIDGFPVHDTSLRMIGNPLPDWMLGCTGHIKRDRICLSFVFDFKKGGDIWNGTRAALDYLGRSSATGSARNTTGYIFEGVTAEGVRNTTAVNFADAGQPIENNRWVRYGWSGVGEDYIEDSSWIRMSELNLSYTIDGKEEHLLRQIKFTLSAHNLFLITPYSGVDPASALFGYSTGKGLDLFNTPAVRSYNAQLTLKI